MPLDWKHLPIYHISYRKQFLLHIAFHDDWEKTRKSLFAKIFALLIKKKCVMYVCMYIYIYIMEIQFLLKRKGIIYILSLFYISIKLISPSSPLPFESNSVGMWRVMSPLVKNGHPWIDIAISTILPWLLLHKMKTKADKDVTRRGESGRQEEWGEENGREKYILSIHNGIVSTTSLHVWFHWEQPSCWVPFLLIQYTFLTHIHCSLFSEKLCAVGEINITLTIRISHLDIDSHNLFNLFLVGSGR